MLFSVTNKGRMRRLAPECKCGKEMARYTGKDNHYVCWNKSCEFKGQVLEVRDEEMQKEGANKVLDQSALDSARLSAPAKTAERFNELLAT